jgi:hypothetical protein
MAAVEVLEVGVQVLAEVAVLAEVVVLAHFTGPWVPGAGTAGTGSEAVVLAHFTGPWVRGAGTAGTGLEETGVTVVFIMATIFATMVIVSFLFLDSAVGVHGGVIPGGGITPHTTIPITEILIMGVIMEVLIMEILITEVLMKVPTRPTAADPITG